MGKGERCLFVGFSIRFFMGYTSRPIRREYGCIVVWEGKLILKDFKRTRNVKHFTSIGCPFVRARLSMIWAWTHYLLSFQFDSRTRKFAPLHFVYFDVYDEYFCIKDVYIYIIRNTFSFTYLEYMRQDPRPDIKLKT